MRYVVVAVVLVLSGCAALAPSPEQAHWQGMADQVTTALKAPRAAVMVQDGSESTYYCEGARIELGTGPNAFVVLAHELGHHLLGHCGAATLQQLQRELDANAEAIKVLQVWGITEADAFGMTIRNLRALQRNRGANPRAGHDYCAELRDLARRYPAQPDPMPGSLCPR